jgi:hypothetical protein
MIDAKGEELYKEMMDSIYPKDNVLTETQKYAMAAFDIHMNRLNKTTGMFYAKNGEVLMKC